MKTSSIAPTVGAVSFQSVLLRRSALALTLVCSAFGVGCSSSGGGSGSGGSSGAGSGGAGGSTAGGAAPFKPCSDATRFGAFALELKNMAGSAPYSQVTGSVRDGVRPADVWVEQAVSGGGSECHLMVGPSNSCSPACNSTQVCKGQSCIAAPVTKSVGDATFSGLIIPVKMTPTTTASGTVVYSGLIDSKTAFPPYTVGDALGLTTAGADYPGATLAGKAIDPLMPAAGQTLNVAKNMPLTIKWVAPSAAGAARIQLTMDIAHHGNVAAEIRCDLPDTGSVTIPAPLITALIDKGAFGFPTVGLQRVSVDSTAIGAGCMEFKVVASVELELNVEGVVSCNDTMPCPSPQVCVMPGYKCVPPS